MRWNDGTIILVSLLVAVLISWPVSYIGFFERTENWIRDYVQVIWGEQADFGDIVIIDIDEISMRALNSQLGAWPYDRQVYAATVEYLRQAGADNIVFDVLFSENRKGDRDFASQLAATDNVYLASILLHDYRFVEEKGNRRLDRHSWTVDQPPVLEQKGLILPQPDFLDKANIGIISVFPDKDGTIRKIPLVFDTQGRYIPAMMLSLMSDQQSHSIRFDWRKDIAIHADYRWPVSDKGAVTLKYPTNMADLQVIPFYQFLLSVYGAGDISPETYRGKTVFIGSTSSVLGDFAYIPGHGRVYGLGILALAYHSLKHGSLLRTDVVLANGAIAMIFLLILVFTIRFKGIRLIPLISGYALSLLLGFILVVLLYRNHNIQAWILLPALIATLFVIFTTFARSFSLQMEGQRLRFEKQAAEEARDLKARFLAHMTHELRTPLTAIMGYNKLLLDREIDRQQQRDYLHIVDKNSEHLLNLINNILDQSQIDAGQLKLVKSEHDIRALLEDILLLLRPVADSKGVELKSLVDDGVPQLLIIDRTRLKQIIINLAGNALKFIEQGEVMVEVYWLDGELLISVKDTGPGIPESDLQNIFRSFQQAESAIASDTRGTGLGLTISTHLANMMGGRITVESKIGQGATFTLRIPAGEGEVSEVKDDATQASVMAVETEGYILLAEDSKDSSTLITLFLNTAGYEVRSAVNGKVVLDMAMQDPPELVLMDMNMPVMDGETATRELRKSGYAGPIIALTASTDEAAVAGMYAAGCTGEIEKPVDAERLVQQVGQYIQPASGL